MEPQSETAVPPPATTVHFVFFNSRGLRAGWRLLVFVAILIVLGLAVLAALGVLSYMLRIPPRAEGVVLPLRIGLGEVAQLLVVVLAAWIMSKIERRKPGVYGLPFTKSALSRFSVGYLVWGFLPLTLLLLAMRGQVPGHLFNPSIQGPEWLSGGSVGPEGSVLTLILWALMTAGFLIFYRPSAGLVVSSPTADSARRM